MKTVRRDSHLHRDIRADVWKNTLSQIKSSYGRLLYLADLRDANSGTYRHHGLALIFGREATDQVLAESHNEVFAEWLRFDLEQQMNDLNIYLEELTESRNVIIQSWLNGKPYLNLPPFGATDAERSLFVQDLEALLETMRNDPNAGARAPAT